MIRRRHGRPTAAGLALVLVALLLAACSSTAAGSGSVTSVGGETTPPSWTIAQVDALVAQHKPAFKSAVKKFRACDRKVSADSYVASPCLDKVVAETAAANALLKQLSSRSVPSESSTTLRDLKTFAAAGAAVAKRCAKSNDQTCDQALARFRADEQSLLWDLDITL